MKISRLQIALALAAFCLMVVPAYLMWNRDPCAHLKHMARSAGRLSASSQVYRWSDHIVGVLHGEPFRYYCEEITKEEQRLLASGYFAETKIRIPADRSDREVHKALHAVCQRTDFYCDASVDVTNHYVLLLSRPQDVATFSAALK